MKIAELRQTLYNLRNQVRDYDGLRNEMSKYESSMFQLKEAKTKNEVDGRLRLDQDMNEIADLRKQKEELAYLLSVSQKENYDLKD